jgi:CBS domain containing-hemolysin-like protein
VTPTVALVLALAALLAVRVAVAVAEVALAGAPGERRGRLAGDDVLASAARAAQHVVCAASAGIVVALVWTHAGRGWVPAALAVAVPVILVVCELVPRGLAAEAPARWRAALDPLVTALAALLAPVLLLERAVVRGSAGAILPALRRMGGWLTARPRGGALDVSEAGLAARIARFAGGTAGDVMVPQVDVCAVPDTASVAEVVALVQERGFSRLPVFHDRMFNAIGVVSSLDLLGVTDPALPVTAVMRDPLFVPETKALPELLATLQAEARNIALVVDEYGGFVGLVTVEDLVEEIVGEIQDEYDPPREHYRRVAPGVYVVSARAPVIEVNERFGWNLPQGDYETVGGLVLERLGRVPKPGDGVDVGRVRIEVTRASARAVQEVRVEEPHAARGPRGR